MKIKELQAEIEDLKLKMISSNGNFEHKLQELEVKFQKVRLI